MIRELVPVVRVVSPSPSSFFRTPRMRMTSCGNTAESASVAKHLHGFKVENYEYREGTVTTLRVDLGMSRLSYLKSILPKIVSPELPALYFLDHKIYTPWYTPRN